MKASERSSADFLSDIKDAGQNAVRFASPVGDDSFLQEIEAITGRGGRQSCSAAEVTQQLNYVSLRSPKIDN